MDRRPLYAVTAAVVAYSIGPVLVGFSTTSAPVFAFWRGWATILVTVAGAAALGRLEFRWPKGREWWAPLVAGCLNGASTMSFIQAVRLTSVAGTTLITLLNPVLIALWAIPLFGERPGIRFRLWTLVAMAGTSVVIAGDWTGPEGSPLGMMLAVLSIVLMSIQQVITKVGRRTLATVPMHVGMAFSGAVFVTVFGLATGHNFLDMTRTDILSVAGVVALPSGMGALLTIWAIRWLPANIPPLINLPIPFLAGGLAWLLLGEVMSINDLLGGLVTLVGVAAALLSRSGRRLIAAGSIPGPPADPASSRTAPWRRGPVRNPEDASDA